MPDGLTLANMIRLSPGAKRTPGIPLSELIDKSDSSWPRTLADAGILMGATALAPTLPAALLTPALYQLGQSGKLSEWGANLSNLAGGYLPKDIPDTVAGLLMGLGGGSSSGTSNAMARLGTLGGAMGKKWYHSTGKSGASISEIDRPLWLTSDRQYAAGVGHAGGTGGDPSNVYGVEVNADRIANFASKRGYTEAEAAKALQKTFPDITQQELEALISPGSFNPEGYPASPHDLSHMIWESGGEEGNAMLAEIALRNGYQGVRMIEKQPGTSASYRPSDPPVHQSEIMLLVDPKAAKLKK